MDRGAAGAGWAALAVALPLVVLGVLLWRHGAFVHDDVFITLRYARNLAETGLPQWNPGEWTEGGSGATTCRRRASS
jgi:hypothetical protein